MLAVVRTGNDAYGMNVRRELEDVTGRAVTIGSVYATLDRLEAKALVMSSRVAGPGASSRRVFAVTADGLRAALILAPRSTSSPSGVWAHATRAEGSGSGTISE